MQKYFLTCIFPNGDVQRYGFYRLKTLLDLLDDLIKMDEEDGRPFTYLVSSARPQTSADYRREEEKK